MITKSNVAPYVNDMINARKEKKISQRKLAEMVDREPSYISKIECGRAIAGGSLLCQIADILGKTIRLV